MGPDPSTLLTPTSTGMGEDTDTTTTTGKYSHMGHRGKHAVLGVFEHWDPVLVRNFEEPAELPSALHGQWRGRHAVDDGIR